MSWLGFVWDGPSTNYPASPSTAWASNPVAILPGTAYFTPDKSLPAPALNYVLWALATECQYNFTNTAQWQATAYTTSQSVTVPAGCNEVLVELCGGGGGGGAGQAGGTSTSLMSTSGAGGGGGQYVLTRLPVTAGDTLVLVVGAGGAAGSNGVASSVTDSTHAASVTAYGGSAGTNGSGGSSSVDTYVTGGLPCPASANPFLGGIGYTFVEGYIITSTVNTVPFIPTTFGQGGAGWSCSYILSIGSAYAGGIPGNYSLRGYAGGAGGSVVSESGAGGHLSGGPGGGGGGGAFGVGGVGGTPGTFNASGAGGVGGPGVAATANTGGGGGGGGGGGSGSSSGGAGGAGGAGGSGKIVLTFLVYGNNPIG
jgi:hypothetical protein